MPRPNEKVPLKAIKCVLFLNCVFWIADVTEGAVGSGPYDCIQLERIEGCERSGPDTLQVQMSIAPSADGRLASGFWSAPSEVGEGIEFRLKCYHWSNGWQMTYAVSDTQDVCKKGMKSAPEIMKIMANASKIPATCPFPAGHYEVENVPTCLKLSKFPTMPYGTWRFDMDLYKKSEFFGCYSFQVSIEPASRPIGL